MALEDFQDGGLSTSFGYGQSAAFSGVNPEMFNASIAATDKLVKAGGTIDSALEDMEEASRRKQAAIVEQSLAIGAAAEHTAKAAGAEAALKLGTQARVNDILQVGRLSSTDPNAQNLLTQQFMQRAFESKEQLDTLGAEIEAKQSVGIFDNPLMWLVNQTRLPGMVGQYNAVASKMNREMEQFNAVTSAAATGISLQQAADVDQVRIQQQETTAANAQKAAADKAKLDEEMAGETARMAATRVQMETARVGAVDRLTALSAQRASASARASSKEEQEAAWQEEADQVNRWYAMLGSDTQFTAKTWSKVSPQKRLDLLNRSGKGRIADDVHTARTYIKEIGNIGKLQNTGSLAFTQWMDRFMGAAYSNSEQRYEAANNQARLTGKSINKDEHFKQEVTNLQNEVVAQDADMLTASPYNPKKLDYVALTNMGDTLRKTPGLPADWKPETAAITNPNNPVVKYVNEFGPNGTIHKDVVKEDILLAALGEQVAAGKITAKDMAAQVKQFYDTAVDMTAELTKYPLVGISYTDSYNVKIPKAGIFSSVVRPDGVVNLKNQASLETFFTRYQAMKLEATTPNWLGIRKDTLLVP